MGITKIAVVERDAPRRERLRSMLSEQPDFVVTVACAPEQFWEHLKTTAVEVVLLDLGLLDVSGLDLITRIRSGYPAISCIAHTLFETPSTVFAALRAGAAGYLIKDSTPTDLLRSLRTLHDGGAPLTARIARMLVYEYHRHEECPLSERELEILQAISNGMSYKEAGSELSLSPHTVHTHVKNINEKLQVSGRKEALAVARKRGWVKSPTPV